MFTKATAASVEASRVHLCTEALSLNMQGQVTAQWNAQLDSETALSPVHVSVSSVTTVDVLHLTSSPPLVPGPHSARYRGKSVNRRGEKFTSALHSIDI